MSNEENRKQEEYNLLLQLACTDKYMFIEQTDEDPSLYLLDESHPPAEGEPLKIVYDMLPKKGRLDDFSAITGKYGIKLFADQYQDDPENPVEL